MYLGSLNLGNHIIITSEYSIRNRAIYICQHDFLRACGFVYSGIPFKFREKIFLLPYLCIHFCNALQMLELDPIFYPFI